eukprot:TRINITY_DN14457_c0_g1_i1.p1 TRINITY_DN14457_c0_g1~~TRINITY_DN14457_c0_g1_i1.p1  ORF type:complete len:194 (+),score=53.04 TRINITY_DN14457_c0_g1_i1:81-584(+)
MEGADSLQIGIGAVFFIANFGGQFIVGDNATETVLLVIGGFMHLVSAGLLSFSILFLFIVIFRMCRKTAPQQRRHHHADDNIDSLIAYSLFCFTGLALSCVGVFLRDGSWLWHFGTIAGGCIASAASEKGTRIAIRRAIQRKPAETPDTWSVPEKVVGARGGLRERI